MNIWGVIRNLNIGQFLRLTWLCIRNLNKLWPTWKATKMSISLADQYYGKSHHKNTAANAFRHAVWNSLIAKKCLKSAEQFEEILCWTKEITDMHEDLFPNDPLARAMDLHNNKVGRFVFRNNSGQLEDDMIHMIHELTRQSVMIRDQEELNDLADDQLVHIENTN